jgi:hypothetical protein
MKCPYYREVGVENHPHEFRGHCEGDRVKGSRQPSLFEETHYCTTHLYPACRVFQARQASVEHQDGSETPSGHR